MLKDYRDRLVWQKSYGICLHVYRATKRFPVDERYGLTAQMRRAAVSVPSNVAEGRSRSTTGDYLRSLRFAYASNSELETRRCWLATSNPSSLTNLASCPRAYGRWNG